MSDGHGHISVKTYFITYLVLLALLVVTVWVAFHHFGIFNLPIALAIGVTKAAIIVMIFMHMKVASKWVPIFFLGSLYVFIFGIILLMSDYQIRTLF